MRICRALAQSSVDLKWWHKPLHQKLCSCMTQQTLLLYLAASHLLRHMACIHIPPSVSMSYVLEDQERVEHCVGTQVGGKQIKRCITRGA